MEEKTRKSLVVVPARGGSKGIPGKNIKLLGGKPLIVHTLEVAREIAEDSCICVSTDDPKIKETVESFGLQVPFLRPAELATDTSGTREVLLHAYDFYKEKGENFDNIILLQCTSPFRTTENVKEAMKLYSDDLDMVVSVKESSSNPYYDLFEEDEKGFLQHSKGEGGYTRRQDVPPVWQYNGAIYIVNPESLKREPLSSFKKVRKYVMKESQSIDLDTPMDWEIAEFLIKRNMAGN